MEKKTRKPVTKPEGTEKGQLKGAGIGERRSIQFDKSKLTKKRDKVQSNG